MPMFYTPKPRQFHYRPRFYDPEKERWDALKQKYADERLKREQLEEAAAAESTRNDDGAVAMTDTDSELAYFERRLREIESSDRAKKRKLTWRDLFQRREMPKFNYQPRFSSAQADGSASESRPATTATSGLQKKHRVNINRRFDISDEDYLKPMPASRIMLYALLVCMLLYWILN